MSDDEDIPELIDIAIEPDISPGPLSESIESAPEKLAAPTYDFDNEPDEPWDAFCPAPSQRVDPKAEVRLIFTRHWLLDDTEERGIIGRPPRWLGMEIQADGFSRSINIPKSFKEAHSTSPAAYREYWLSLKRSSAFSLLTANQKDVIRGTLATMRFFCDDSPQTRCQWPHFRKFLFRVSEMAGEDGIPGEQLFGALRDWARHHFKEALNTRRWEEDSENGVDAEV
ncbi:hypothetical protein LXA43DRAFT_1096457 [Ganoderma leucocontextum]|nr:hypothetical protein LXA43DRAFT_1096457 [Ganoderma leucocontextum]